MPSFVHVADSHSVLAVPCTGFGAGSGVWAHGIEMLPHHHMHLAVLGVEDSIVQMEFVSNLVEVSADCTALQSSFVMMAHTTPLLLGSCARALMESAGEEIDGETAAEGRKTVLTALDELPTDVQKM
jgi:hypothetical protein